MQGRARLVTSAVCGALGVFLIFAALLFGYLTRSLFNERAFADRVASSLEDPRFAGYVAEQITDAAIKARPDLIGIRPVLIGVARSIVGTPPFRAAVRRGARVAHHTLMSGSAKSIVLDVRDVSVMLESVAQTQPGIAKKIPKGLSTALGSLGQLPGGERAAQLARAGRRMKLGSWGTLLLGIGLCVVSVRLSAERRRGIVRIGITLATLGVLLGIVARFGGSGVGLFARHAEHSPAIAGLVSAFLSGLMTWAAGLLFAGLVLAAAAASLLERVPLRQWRDGVWNWAAGPQERMIVRLLRGVVGALIGAMFLFAPLFSLTIVAWLFGLALGFVGLREGFVAALHMLPQADPATRRGAERRRPSGAAIAVASGIAVALLAGTAWMIMRSDAGPLPTGPVTTYNGLAQLGDRRLDQVVIPTSHNSMAGADIPGWMFPNQNAGMRKQLEDGVRGFLIDVHYGMPVGKKVKTDLTNEVNAVAKYEAALGKDGVEAALRIRERMAGQEQGERDVYMCHGFCELGAEKFVPVLEDIRDFLVANPGEVLVLVIQDESVTFPDIDRCFRESGLIDFVYRGPTTAPWPTMRELVESDQRVVVMAENQKETVEWYHPALQVLQETPYSFRDTTQFSNEPFRGGTAGSLALLNHWIETTPLPKPSNAAIVNRHDFLMARIRAFQKRRGRLPNLVAVDFYGTGDLVQVCRELNEEPLPAKQRSAKSRR